MELASAMFGRMDTALGAAIDEDWDSVALCLVSALQYVNDLRAVLRIDERKPE